MATCGSQRPTDPKIRQLTFERDTNVSIGVPVWSPTSGTISFIMSREGTATQWLINHDGSGLRQFVNGLWPHWSPDGRWLYHVVARDNAYILQKTSPDGGEPITVRTDDVVAPMRGTGRHAVLCISDAPHKRPLGMEPAEGSARNCRRD